jgi:PST family polysaccharide transporter
MLVLARLLEPHDFGIYAVLIAAASIGYNLVASGFVYVFTRSPTAVPEADIQAAFWSFEALYLVVAALLLAGSFLYTSTDAHLIMRALAFFFLLAPFRFPAYVRCWRNIELGRLAIIEASEVVVFQVSAVGFVLAGYGVRAFGYALILGAATSAILAMRLARWWPQRPQFRALRPWISKARPYFVSGALNLWQANSNAPLLALVFGATIAGFYGWAAGFSAALVALAVVLTQAMFVGFAHVREHDRVVDGASFAVRILALTGGGLIAVVAGGADPITKFVFAPRWLPGVDALRLLIGAVVVTSLLLLFINLALADGRVRTANFWLLLLCAGTVALGLPLAAVLGLKGYTGAYLLVSVFVLVFAWRQTLRVYALDFALTQYVALIVVCAVAGACIASAVGCLALAPIWLLLATVGAGGISYLLPLLIFSRGGPWKDARKMLAILRS